MHCIYNDVFRVDWDSEPLRIITSRAPIDENVDYPAVTICNTFPYDRWGFLRDLLNQAKFLCNGEGDCQAGQNILSLCTVLHFQTFKPLGLHMSHVCFWY